jgi:hypothetical protein
MTSDRKAILDRIKHLEGSIAKATAYLERGEHATWVGFRPFFAKKLRAGKELPPHRDWVRNVFLPRAEKALKQAEGLSARLASERQV